MKERVSIVHAVVADEAVAALLALINHGDCIIRVHILEHKELVPKQVHLKYRLLRGHGLYGEALAADDLELLVRLVRNCGESRTGVSLQRALSETLLKTGLVSADLALYRGNAGINRCVHVARKFACPVIHAVVVDGDLGEEAAALNAESNVSIGLGLEEPVELSYLSYRIGPQILGGLHLFLGKSELHL